jgi:hypothetical protein
MASNIPGIQLLTRKVKGNMGSADSKRVTIGQFIKTTINKLELTVVEE